MSTPTSEIDEAPEQPVADGQPDDPNSIYRENATLHRLVELYRENATLQRERAERSEALNNSYSDTLALQKEHLATYAETLSLKNEVIASLRRRLAIYEPDASTPKAAS